MLLLRVQSTPVLSPLRLGLIHQGQLQCLLNFIGIDRVVYVLDPDLGTSNSLFLLGQYLKLPLYEGHCILHVVGILRFSGSVLCKF